MTNPAIIDDNERSTQLPVLYLLLKGFAWLVLATFLLFLASLKLYKPGLFAEWEWLGYGRLQPAGMSALVYGFASQVGLGIALWILTRLGKTRLAGTGVIVVASGFWNLAVALGVASILAG